MSMKEECCWYIHGKGYFMPSDRASLGWGSQGWGNTGWGGAGIASAGIGSFLGNIPELSLNINHSFRQVANISDYIQYPDCVASLIESIEISMQLTCMNDTNLNIAYWGETKQIAQTLVPVTDLVVTNNGNGYRCGEIIFFEKYGVDINSIIVKRSDTLAALIPNIDYEVTPAGIVLRNDFNFSASTTLLISYNYNSSYKVTELFNLKSLPPINLTFVGTNMMNNQTVMIQLYKVKLSPASNFPIVSGDFVNLELQGMLQPDYSRGSGFSPWGRIIRIN